MDVTEIICKSTVHFCAVYFIATFLCAHLRKNSIFHTPSISNKKKGVTQLFLLCWYCIFYWDFKERTFRLEHSTWTISLWLNYCTPLALCCSLSTIDKCSDHALSRTFFAPIGKFTQMHCQTHSKGLSLRTALSLQASLSLCCLSTARGLFEMAVHRFSIVIITAFIWFILFHFDDWQHIPLWNIFLFNC